jgi:hypothetical protein
MLNRVTRGTIRSCERECTVSSCAYYFIFPLFSIIMSEISRGRILPKQRSRNAELAALWKLLWHRDDHATHQPCGPRFAGLQSKLFRNRARRVHALAFRAFALAFHLSTSSASSTLRHLPDGRRCRERNLDTLCWGKRAAGESSALPRRHLASPPFTLHEHGQPLVSSPPRPPVSTPPAPPALCINTVTRIGMPADASDGCCDDGGPGAEDPDGQYDCTDFLEHCVRARCETGRKEHVGVGEEGRSRDVLDGESGWLSSSASTGWRALNAKRPRHSFTYQPSARGRRARAQRARLSAAISQASTAPRRMPLCWPSSLNPPLLGSAPLTL